MNAAFHRDAYSIRRLYSMTFTFLLVPRILDLRNRFRHYTLTHSCVDSHAGLLPPHTF